MYGCARAGLFFLRMCVDVAAECESSLIHTPARTHVCCSDNFRIISICGLQLSAHAHAYASKPVCSARSPCCSVVHVMC